MELSKIILASLALLLISSVGCEQACAMDITSKVSLASYEGGVPSANVQPGASASNLEGKLFVHRQPDLPQLSPIGNPVATTVTDKQGKYQFEVQIKTLPQGCDKLVVFVDSGSKGYQVINVASGMMQVDLIKRSIPLP